MIAFVKQIQLISNNDPRLARLKIQEKLNSSDYMNKLYYNKLLQ